MSAPYFAQKTATHAAAGRYKGTSRYSKLAHLIVAGARRKIKGGVWWHEEDAIWKLVAKRCSAA